MHLRRFAFLLAASVFVVSASPLPLTILLSALNVVSLQHGGDMFAFWFTNSIQFGTTFVVAFIAMLALAE